MWGKCFSYMYNSFQQSICPQLIAIWNKNMWGTEYGPELCNYQKVLKHRWICLREQLCLCHTSNSSTENIILGNLNKLKLMCHEQRWKHQKKQLQKSGKMSLQFKISNFFKIVFFSSCCHQSSPPKQLQKWACKWRTLPNLLGRNGMKHFSKLMLLHFPRF